MKAVHQSNTIFLHTKTKVDIITMGNMDGSGDEQQSVYTVLVTGANR